MQKHNGTAQAENGDIITTASIQVFLANTGTPASLFEDDETTPLNNPFTSNDSNYDAKGMFFFKAANGVYDIKLTNGGDVTWVPDVTLFDPDDAGFVLNKTDAITAPTATDDSNAGYSVLSKWANITLDDAYICVDASVGAAIWKSTTDTPSTIYLGTAAGTADALTATLTPTLTSLDDEPIISLRALLPNATTTPTLAPDGLTAWTIVKNGSQPLSPGDIAGVDHELWLKINATNTEYELLNPAINSISESQLDFTVQLTESFTSSEQTITTAGSLVIAHSLGSQPSLVQVKVICKTAENGFSVDDELIMTALYDDGVAIRGTSIVIDATNLNIRYANIGSVYTVPDKSTGSRVGLTNANWKLIIKAWA